jgi:hypothetical protein
MILVIGLQNINNVIPYWSNEIKDNNQSDIGTNNKRKNI